MLVAYSRDYKYPSIIQVPISIISIQVPLEYRYPLMAKAASMPAKSSLALYIGKGGQRTPMGLKLTSLMIFMHSISNPLPVSKREVYKRDDLPKAGN